MEFAKDAFGEVGGNVADTDLSFVDTGLGADDFCGLKTFFEEAVDYGTGIFKFLCDGKGLFHLPEYFGFAEDLRVESGGE